MNTQRNLLCRTKYWPNY